MVGSDLSGVSIHEPHAILFEVERLIICTTNLVHQILHVLWQVAFVDAAPGRAIIVMLLERRVVGYQLQRQWLLEYL